MNLYESVFIAVTVNNKPHLTRLVYSEQKKVSNRSHLPNG